MKIKTLFSALTTVLLMWLLSSCQEKPSQGQVVFTLGDVFDIEEVTKGQVSKYTTIPSASDFDLVVSDDYSIIWSGKLKDWDVNTKFKSGSYKVKASFGKEGEEGAHKPFFLGEKLFTINSPGIQTVSIDVSLANCIMAASFSSDFKKYFTAADLRITTASSNQLSINYDHDDAVFVDPSRVTVGISLASQGGSVQSLSREFTGLKPATCYTLHFAVSDIGANTFTISFDNQTETIDLGTIDLNR